MRVVLAAAAWCVTVWLPVLVHSLVLLAAGSAPTGVPVLEDVPGHWAFALLVPVPLVLLYAALVGLGSLTTAAARGCWAPHRSNGSPRWRRGPNSCWSARASPASCTTRSATR